MSKKELETSLKKNLLDLEYQKNFNLFSTCLVLSTTVLGLTFSAIPLFGLEVQTKQGATILLVGLSAGILFLILAYRYKNKYQNCFNRIQNLLDGVSDAKLE
jgi:hypothetical protein